MFYESEFEKKQKEAIQSIREAIVKVNALKTIVAGIPNHKNYDLEWAFEGLLTARCRIESLNPETYKHVKP